MRKLMLMLVAAGLVGTAVLPMAAGADEKAADKTVAVKPAAKPIVQIAILLDTSNSMDGLIEQAKTQLWRIVNEFAKADRAGLRPDIEVALYHYGTPSLGAETGYIKQLTPLTTDLDKVSDELFKLKTNGGDEYCGQVIQKAAKDLKWSEDKTAYKAIFIAGNEPFTQGTVKYEEACKEAIAKGIVVNTIFCGDEKEGIDGKWKDGAALADGTYMAINQDKKIVHIDAPQDKELAELSTKLNGTYIVYGKSGKEGAANQMRQDANAAGVSGQVMAQRAAAKASSAYQNGGWDLVDGVNGKQVQLKDMKAEELPPELAKLDEKGREAYVANKAKERAELQKKIQELSAARDKYVADKAKEQGGDKTLDAAVIEAVHTQAQRANLNFEKGK